VDIANDQNPLAQEDRIPFITLILIFPIGGECTVFGPGAKLAAAGTFQE
jgi:hypothetical protein